jgi:glutathione synthase/RimK-type ligase-like ATP-grasp enzyme
MSQILILKGDKPNEQSEAYQTYTGLREIGTDTYSLASYSDLVFEISDETYKVYYEEDGARRDLADFDLVYIRDFRGYEPERNCVAHYLRARKKRFVNSDVGNFQYLSKLTQYAQFATHGVPIPRSVYGHGSKLEALVASNFELPVIVKAITANSGEDNYLVRTAEELKELAARVTGKYIIQEFVPNERDFRVIVLEDEVKCVYSRERKEGEHRNNVSQGGNKTYLDLAKFPEDHKQLAIKAAQLLSREICGVDLMVNSDTGKALILEANFNFGIRAIPGVISEELHGLAEYLHKKAAE